MSEAIGPFSTSTLLSVLENLKRPNTGLLNAFFPTLITSQTETISFDIDEGRRYLAPFVHPLSVTPVKQMKDQKLATYTPAYVKEKARWQPDKALRRAVGEAFGGSMSPDERRSLAIAMELQDQSDRILRRKEKMAFDGLFAGQIVVEGEGYPSEVVNFGRDTSLLVAANTLTGSARWNQSGSNPLDNLDDMSEKTSELAGTPIYDVVLDTKAWKAFRSNTKVQRDLEIPKYSVGEVQSLEPSAEGLQFKGTYGSYRIWMYLGFYTPANGGADQRLMNDGYGIGVGAVDGVQHQGAIMDEEANGYQAYEIYPDSWVEKDPSVRWIRSQSAPLVVPRRTNAVCTFKVLGDS